MRWQLKPYCPKQAFSETRCTRFHFVEATLSDGL